MADHSPRKLPPITVVAADLPRLRLLSTAAAEKFPDTADYLAREIERARVVSGPKVPPELVRMGSQVDYREENGGQVRSVRLVYPEEADVSAARISVLTPVGAALIGLSVGQTIAFRVPNGEARSLTVLAVRDAA